MVVAGSADVAAIDCVLYALLERHRPQALNGVRAICCSQPMPAPPYVTGAHLSAPEVRNIREAVAETLCDPELQPAMEALLLEDIREFPIESYEPIAALERDALDLGYGEFSNANRRLRMKPAALAALVTAAV